MIRSRSRLPPTAPLCRVKPGRWRRSPCPRRRDPFVIRLWPRIGVFRMLSVAVLVLGVVAGIYLSAGRQSQQRVVQSAQVAQSEQDEQRELRTMFLREEQPRLTCRCWDGKNK